MSLIIAGKAPLVSYPTLIAASLVNSAVSDSIKVEYIDDKSTDAKDANAAAKLIAGDETVLGSVEVLNALAAKYPAVLAEKDASQKWVEFAFNQLSIKDFKKLSVDLEKLNSHLNLRSFVVGYDYTLADVAVWGVLRANAVMGSVIKSGVYINISRWYLFLEAKFGGVAETFTKSLAEVRKNAKAATVAKGGKKETHKANFDIDLKGAIKGQVVTRFPPEPSGYLHIGHVKAAVLNQYFAKAYDGKLIIRFDDTNPSKEKEEFQDSIIEDLELLGIKGDQVTFSSNYFDKMYELCVQLIKDGEAYCDDTPVERMREERMDGIKSARRDRTVEENLKIFTEDMKNATEEGLKSVVRAKIDFENKNKALRDPTIYRCNLTPHHRTGTKWSMYPTYDFCVPIVDSIEGVTHSLRTNEYRDRNPQYEWFIEKLHLRPVSIWDFGRVNFVRTLLSKRKLQWFVDNGKVANWDDPRFPTVRGVRRRGMTIEGLRNFILAQGPSKNIINLDWSAIWATNKKIIDPVAPRHTAISSENAVVVNLVDGPEKPITEEKAKHKKNPEVGVKPVIFASKVLVEQADAATFAEGEEVTFMDWGNVIVEKIHKEGDVVKSIDAKLHLEGDFRKTSKKVTWLADTEDKVEVDLVDFDHLITKDKLEEDDKFEDFLTPETEFHTAGFGDLNVRNMKKGDIIQFERKGYYIIDQAFDGKKAVLFTIPDGKAASK